MPCEYCGSTLHTLMICNAIDVNILFQQFNRLSRYHNHIEKQDLTIYIGGLETPVLKRLTKLLGGTMSQSRTRLEEYCMVLAEHKNALYHEDREALRLASQRTDIARNVNYINNRLADRIVHVVEDDEPIFVHNTAVAPPVVHVVEDDEPIFVHNTAVAPPVVHVVEDDEDVIPIENPFRQIINPPVAVATRTLMLRDYLYNLLNINNTRSTTILPVIEPYAPPAPPVPVEPITPVRNNPIRHPSRPTRPTPTMPTVPPPVMRQTTQTINDLTNLDIYTGYIEHKKTIQASSLNTKEYCAENCSICFDKSFIQTNCQHCYCNCILHHLSKNGASCPICRQDITSITYSHNDFYESTLKIAPIFNTTGKTVFVFNSVDDNTPAVETSSE